MPASLHRLPPLIGLAALAPLGWLLFTGQITTLDAALRGAGILVAAVALRRLASAAIRLVDRQKPAEE